MVNARNPGRGRRRHTLQSFPTELISMSVYSDISEQLARFGKEINEKVIRSGVYAGAKIVYDRMRLEVPIGDGTLRDAIYHWYDDKRSSETRKVYMIGPNKKKAPHWYNVEYGHWRTNLVLPAGATNRKYGKPVMGAGGEPYLAFKMKLNAPVWVPGNPYIWRTWDITHMQALNAMKERMRVRLREVINDLYIPNAET